MHPMLFIRAVKKNVVFKSGVYNITKHVSLLPRTKQGFCYLVSRSDKLEGDCDCESEFACES